MRHKLKDAFVNSGSCPDRHEWHFNGTQDGGLKSESLFLGPDDTGLDLLPGRRVLVSQKRRKEGK